ncbi:YisL family protein [Neobacillus sp. PS3-40]|uniref:YisL family protein n=1 Tax=Neobacillus sp. PS3-40 TaxID=3070679 RepID=UPI0027E0A703|nr:YisL family protein [Neobacillus sp. PS3-40]WML45788.1 YisL family protein [Neobacillus sp. PS3-40]
MTHTHITTIVLTIILFLIAVTMQKKGKNIKVLQMVLRVMYLLIIVTGGMLFLSVYTISFLYILKALLGLVMIGLFEMIVSVGKKGKSNLGLWVLFGVALIALLYLGLKLPMGFYLFTS